MWKIIVLVCWMTVLSVFDLADRRVPLFMMAAGSLAAVLQIATSLWEKEVFMGEYLIGWLPCALFLAAAYGTGKVGYADGWLLWIVGSVLTYRQCIVSFFISLCLISGISILLIVMRRANRNTQLPYIPFLTASVGVQAVYLIYGG